jgi:hypothetical protein
MAARLAPVTSVAGGMHGSCTGSDVIHNIGIPGTKRCLPVQLLERDKTSSLGQPHGIQCSYIHDAIICCSHCMTVC